MSLPAEAMNIGYGPLVQAKNDVRRMLDIVRESRGYFEYMAGSSQRFQDTLARIYENITIV